MIKNSQKQTRSLRVAIIIILVIATTGLLGFVFWKNNIDKDVAQTNSGTNTSSTPVETNDPYEGWKSYDNSRDGYSIKYPSSWFMTSEAEGDGPYIRNFDPNNSSNELKDGQYSGYPLGAKYLRVLVDKNENGKKNDSNMSTTEWYGALGSTDIQDMGPVKYLANEVKSLTVNGLEAKSAKSAFTETNEVIYLLKGADLYSVWLYPYGSSDDKEINLILNSFEYL